MRKRLDSGSFGKGTELIPIQLDITDDGHILAAASHPRIAGEGGLDCLVNNAAVAFYAPEAGPLKASPEANSASEIEKMATLRKSFNDVYATNLTATYILTRALFPALVKDKARPFPPSIVNVSSTLGSVGSYLDLPPDFPAAMAPGLYPEYAVTKAALNSATAMFGQWFREAGVDTGAGTERARPRVLSICPGYNATKINGYSGTLPPSEGGGFIAQVALDVYSAGDREPRGFYRKEGVIPW